MIAFGSSVAGLEDVEVALVELVVVESAAQGGGPLVGEFVVEVGESFDQVVFGRVELVWFDVFRHGLLSGRLR